MSSPNQLCIGDITPPISPRTIVSLVPASCYVPVFGHGHIIDQFTYCIFTSKHVFCVDIPKGHICTSILLISGMSTIHYV